MEERAILIHYNTTTGEFKIEAEGFEGLSCLEATQPFEEALGIVDISDRIYKPESEAPPHRLERHTSIRQQRHAQ